MISHGWWVYVGMGAVGLESLLYFAQPTWLARLAFLPGPERRFTLASRRRDERALSSYRESALTDAPLPILPARTELSTAVLSARGPRLALRRAYDWTNNNSYWLYGVRIRREGADVILRARQALFGLSVPLVMAFLLMGTVETDVAAAVVFTFFGLFILGTQRLWQRAPRDAALREAFDFIEAEIRRGMSDEDAHDP